LLKYKENGNAILLISEDLDELKMLSDRIAVMYEGEILGIVEPDVENEKIGLLMGGTRGVPDSCK
jgi:simple sugar transport system ATP-binding protein